MDEVVDGFMRESEIDYISLPDIVFDARMNFGAKTTQEALQISLEIVRRLYEKGLRPAEHWGGPFDYWPDGGSPAMMGRIKREWIAAGEDPSPAHPICWFARMPPAVRG